MPLNKVNSPFVAIITGAASGIGRHWASVLQQQREYRLLLGDVDEPGLQKTFGQSEYVHLFCMDVRRATDWQKVIEYALEHFGKIDYLFNIAGGG